MKLIGIAGKAGVGKDTLGTEIVDWTRFYYGHGRTIRRNLADSLKSYCAHKYGIAPGAFYNPNTKEVPDPYWGVSPRQIAQFEGTEATRDIVHRLIKTGGADFWIRRLQKDLKDFYNDYEIAVVCDIRFQNEADWILNSGGLLIDVIRPGYEGEVGISNHQSERGFNVLNTHMKGKYNVIINDKTISKFLDDGIKIAKQFLGINHD